MSKSLDVCRVEVGERFSGALRGTEFKALLKDLEEYLPNVDLNDPIARKNFEDLVKTRVQKMAGDESRRIATLEKLDPLKAHVKQAVFIGDESEALDSLLHFNKRIHKSDVAPAERLINQVMDRQLSMLMQTVANNPGIEMRLAKGEFNRDLLRTLMGGRGEGLSPEVKEVAEAMRTILNHNFQLKRDAQFNTRYLKNYAGKQYHPAQKLKDLGEDEWKNLAKDKFDWDEMKVKTEDDRNEFLDLMWDKVTKRSTNPIGVLDDELRTILFPQSKRLEAGRSIVFKDGDALADYYEGLNINYFENFIRDIESDSRHIGMAMKFGPDFARSWKKLRQELRVQAEENGTLAKFEQREKELDRNFNLLVHGPGHPEQNLKAKFGDKTRKIVDMTRLQLSLASTLTDNSIAAGVISKTTGRNYLSTHLEIMKEGFKLFKNNKDRRLAAAKMGVFIDDVNAINMRGKIGEEMQLSGAFDKLHYWLMKMTGLPRQALAMRTAIAKFMSTDLWESAGMKWGELYEGKRDVLSKFGINEKDWDIVRGAVDDFGDGTKGITMEAIMDLDISETQKSRLSLALSSYLAGVSELGSPTPNMKNQAWKIAMDPNTYMGQLARFVGQYKSFALSQLESMAFIHHNPNKRFGDIKLIAATAASSTAMGYMALVMKDWAKGKKARDPLEAKTWIDAGMQGGVGLIYGDFIMTDLTKWNRSVQNQIMGPGPGLINDTGRLLWKAMKGDAKAKDALKFIERNSPTIPFKKTILDKEVHEAIYRGLNGDFSKIKPFEGY